MLNSLRTIGLSFILSLSLVGNAMAGTIMYGKVRIDPNISGGYAYYHEACDDFPLKGYTFRPAAYDLKYNDQISLQDREKNLNDFNLRIDADLTLVSFDKDTGIYKFNLKLDGGDWLHYIGRWPTGTLFETGGVSLKGGRSLKLADGKPLEFIIEGRLETINGKAQWISLNRNKYFDIEVKTSFNCKYPVYLKLLQDFPVMVSSEK